MRLPRAAGLVGFPVALASLLAACADAPSGDLTTQVTDSAGVTIAFSRVDTVAPVCPLSEERVRIGSLADDSASQLFGVRAADRFADGRIVVLNGGTSEVKIFDLTGGLVTRFGRRGDGPGEFRNVWSLDVGSGDTIVVGEYRPWRFSFFTAEGDFVRSVEASPPVIERPEVGMVLSGASGFWVGQRCCFGAEEGFSDQHVVVESYDAGGAVRDTLGSFWFVRYGLLSEELGFVGSPIFGARAAFAHYPGDTLAYAPGRSEQVELRGPDGTLGRVIRWRSRDRAVRPADVERWKQDMRDNAPATSSPMGQAVLEAQVGDHRPVADSFPAVAEWSGLQVGPGGAIWVKEYRRPFDEGPDRWLVFDREGTFTCQVGLPEGTVLLDVGEESVLLQERDELDVESVVEVGLRAASRLQAHGAGKELHPERRTSAGGLPEVEEPERSFVVAVRARAAEAAHVVADLVPLVCFQGRGADHHVGHTEVRGGCSRRGNPGSELRDDLLHRDRVQAGRREAARGVGRRGIDLGVDGPDERRDLLRRQESHEIELDRGEGERIAAIGHRAPVQAAVQTSSLIATVTQFLERSRRPSSVLSPHTGRAPVRSAAGEEEELAPPVEDLVE